MWHSDSDPESALHEQLRIHPFLRIVIRSSFQCTNKSRSDFVDHIALCSWSVLLIAAGIMVSCVRNIIFPAHRFSLDACLSRKNDVSFVCHYRLCRYVTKCRAEKCVCVCEIEQVGSLSGGDHEKGIADFRAEIICAY